MLPISSNGETVGQSQAATGVRRPAALAIVLLLRLHSQGMFFTFACAYLPKWTPVPEIWAAELAVLARRCYNAGR